jgi:hypothetical protein
VPNFATTVVNATTTPSQYTTVVDLPRAVTLYWRVRANGANGPSIWADGGDWASANPPSVPVLASPAANALTTDYTPLLQWGDSTGGLVYYELQVSRTAAFDDLEIDNSSVAASEYEVPADLTSNRTYWWRVRSANPGGYSNWSAVRTLRTALDAPEGLGSVDLLLTTRPKFEWSVYGGSPPNPTNHTIQVSTSATFASTVVNATASGLSYTPTVDLPKNVMLYWRLRANGANGPSLWADGGGWLSANPPSVPALTSPAANALTTDLTPKLDWGTSTGTVTDYQVQVSTSSTFGTTVEDELTGTTSEYTPTVDLAPNTTFYWRVRSYNGSAYSLWSAVRALRTALDAPMGLGSADLLLTTRPKFEWSVYGGSPPNPTNYTIQVSTSPVFASTVVNATATGTSYTPTVNLPKNVMLYWRLRANGANGPSLWADGGGWLSANPPGIPSLISPAANALVPLVLNGLDEDYATATLDFVPVALPGDFYRIQVASDPGFTVFEDNSLEPHYPDLLPGHYYYTTMFLSPNSTHWWRVRSENSDGEYSLWSSVRTFRTRMKDPPTLLAPANATITTNRRPTFEWSSVPTATSYTIQICTDGVYGSCIVNTTVAGTTFTPTVNLPQNKVLDWRVRANGPNGPSPWSVTQPWDLLIVP